jgi:tRNA(Ile)-lysidine synthase
MQDKLKTEFQNYIANHQLFSVKDRLLLAFSGGPDSVCLADLLLQVGFRPALVHINFHLRGKDADTDAAFCEKYAAERNLQFYFAEFDTQSFAQANKYSTEEAARILRYNEFQKIAEKNNYKYILTAHHTDDNAETFLINFVFGTGIRGLSGMKPTNGNIVRPLLFASKEAILDYCKNRKLTYRIDKSNSDNRFVRNRIRNLIIPELKKINPSFLETAQRNFRILSDTEDIYLRAVGKIQKEISRKAGDRFLIDIEKLKKQDNAQTVLFEILYGFGFNASVTRDILDAADSESGKLFLSKTHVLLKDRENYIVKKQAKSFTGEIELPQENTAVWKELGLELQTWEITENEKSDYEPGCAYLDADKIYFPLIYRAPKTGDRFRPLGMRGKKLLSNYFVDKKMDYFQKKESRVLLSNNEIVWIVGDRINDDFKINENTKRVLKIRQV